MGLSPQDLIRIRVLGKPVLCLDTCSILDLMRAITRDDVNPTNLKSAQDLLATAESGGGLVVLIAEQVSFELGDNAQAIYDDAEAALVKFRARAKDIDAVACLYGASGAMDTAHLTGHAQRAQDVVNRLVAAATIVPRSDDILGKAFLRVNSARTPGATGKQSMKDCVVVETYLEAIQSLRAHGHNEKAVFLSSNIKDYFEPSTKHIAADIGADFASVTLDFATNWTTAKFYLGL